MTYRLGVVIDPPETLAFKTDTSIALILAARHAGLEIYYLNPDELYLLDGDPRAYTQRLFVKPEENHWFEMGDSVDLPLNNLDLIWMRKDPPVTLEYFYITHILEHAEKSGVLVINKPQAVRDANVKLFSTHFAHCCPTTLISAKISHLRAFWQTHSSVVFKPLDAMGGRSIFVAHKEEPNINVILETLTHYGTQHIVAQRYLPEIATSGDKRIILLDGTPIPYALARIPAPGDTRANLAAGGTGHVVPLTERDNWLCREIAPTLKARGLFFVGLDVIGDYITEINVTSPTGIRGIEKETGLDIAGLCIELLQEKLALLKKSPLT